MLTQNIIDPLETEEHTNLCEANEYADFKEYLQNKFGMDWFEEIYNKFNYTESV